jgi:DNA polymerase-3 subunit alpha
LEKFHEGLIATSACLGGEIPRYITEGMQQEAEKAVQWYRQVFGEDFYLELQLHKPTVPNAAQDTYPKQVAVNKVLIELAQRYHVK